MQADGWVSVEERLPEVGQWVVLKRPPYVMRALHDYSRTPSLVGAERTAVPAPPEVRTQLVLNEVYNELWFMRYDLIIPVRLLGAFGVTHWKAATRRGFPGASGTAVPAPAAARDRPYNITPEERGRRAERMREHWRRKKAKAAAGPERLAGNRNDGQGGGDG